MVKKNRIVIIQNSVKTVYLFRIHYIKKLLINHDVIVIAPNDDKYSRKSLIDIGVAVYNIPYFNGFFGLILAAFFMNILIIKERAQYSKFICHFISTFILCFISLVPFNNKLIVYVEGLGSNFSNNKFLQRILRFLLKSKNITRVFCNTYERRILGLLSDFVSGGIGIDVNKFKATTIIGEGSNKRLFVITYVGRLIKDKGVLDAIFVLRNLRENNVNVKLILAGDIYLTNPSSLSTKDLISLKREFGDNIEFVGFTNDIREIYNKTEVLLLPSIREGFPVCVMEASAMGVPCVGYTVPGVSDAIKIEVNGLLASFKDKKQLSYLTYSLLNEIILDKYKASSRKYAVNNFSNVGKSNDLLRLISKM